MPNLTEDAYGPLCAKKREKAFLLSPDKELRVFIRELAAHDGLDWSFFNEGKDAVEHLFTDPPDVLVVDSRIADMPMADLVALIKSENVYRQLPVILCLDPADLARGVNWKLVEAEDFLLRPLTKSEVQARLSLALCRASRSLDANPLTKLPGNTSIIQRIQEMIDNRQDFALAYADLDYFKSFNDKYGFSRGDEALMMTARIVVNIIRGLGTPFSFVGHVGGDDFVFITPVELVETACKQIVDSFDAIVPNFYDQEDRDQGFIHSKDRQGATRDFPLMALSIAVVLNQKGRLKHYGEASQIAMAMKKVAKENPKSCYVVDRRQT